MYIRYQHVRNTLLLLGVTGTIAYCASGDPEPPAPRTPVLPTQALAPPVVPQVPARMPAAAQEAASPDGQILALASAPAQPGGKIKDALRGQSWKANIYEDSGDAIYDRIKIDRNRDETWDETWNFKKGRWEKEGGQLVWGGSSWVADGATASAAVPSVTPVTAPVAPVAPADPLLDVARRMLSEKAAGPKLKDVLSGRGPKINLYDDDGNGSWDRAKVDLDRNEDDDEKWTVKNGNLERKIVSSGQVLLYEQGAWVPKR